MADRPISDWTKNLAGLVDYVGVSFGVGVSIGCILTGLCGLMLKPLQRFFPRTFDYLTGNAIAHHRFRQRVVQCALVVVVFGPAPTLLYVAFTYWKIHVDGTLEVWAWEDFNSKLPVLILFGLLGADAVFGIVSRSRD